MASKVETLTSPLIAEQTGVPPDEHEGIEEIEIIFSTVHDIGSDVRTSSIFHSFASSRTVTYSPTFRRASHAANNCAR